MNANPNINPYEFTIHKDGDGWYEYRIRTIRHRQPVCGGIVKTRKQAEREARQRIATLPKGH